MALTAFVDLSTGGIRYAETDPSLRLRFLGGRGLGAKLLFDRVGPETTPFDPGNCLIFTTGPFSGTSWPTASRYHVTFKSPATGAYGYANAGGHFAPELARAGFDALVITGKAEMPVYLSVGDRAVTIHSAGHLWGETTTETQDRLLGDEGRNGRNGRVLCIGPAGENLVRIAAIINDYGRAAARGGPGAVMGSKLLKAIHVRPSSHSQTPPPLAEVGRQMSKRLIADPRMAGLMAEGTLALMRPKNLTGDLPAKNHQQSQVPFIDDIDAAAIGRYRRKRVGCASCPVRCSRISVVEEGEYKAEIEGPEYESTDALGPMCWNGDPAVIIRANQLCNEFGLDTISTGVVIAFAMESHERGVLQDSDISLEWGDGTSIVGLIEKIALRQGIGDLLAEGVKRAAKVIGGGSGAWAMHVKGLEMPRQEPRFAKGFGLGHATSNRGADHLYGLPTLDVSGNWDKARQLFPQEIVEELMEPSVETYKPDMLIYGEHFSAISDSLGICKFSTCENYSLLPDDLAEGLRATGIDVTGDALLEIGERIVNLERLYNTREGFGRPDDQLPARFGQPLPLLANETDPKTGETSLGTVLRSGQLFDFEKMLYRYYSLRGWNAEGRPMPPTLARLGLEQEGKAAAK